MRVHRRHLVITSLASLAFVTTASAASASTDTTIVEVTASTAPAASDSAATDTTTGETTAGSTDGTMAAGDDAGLDGQIYDDDGNLSATVSVVGVENNWTGYGDDDGPDDGDQFVRVTLLVESQVGDGTFDVNVDDFILQDMHGGIDEGESKDSADDVAASIDVTDDAELSNGESVELAVVFAVDPAVGPKAVFYRPDEDTLVTITDIAVDA